MGLPPIISVTLRPWGKGCPLTTLLVSRNFCQMAGAQSPSNDQLSGTGHTPGGQSRLRTLTLGLRLDSKQRLSPDIAGAGALGAAEAGPGRSLARWGMGKEGNGDVLGQRQAAECSLLPCGPNPSSCHLGYCYGSMAQEGQGGVKMVLVLTGWPALTHVST